MAESLRQKRSRFSRSVPLLLQYMTAQTNVVYEVDAPYDGVNTRAFRNEPGNLVTYTRCGTDWVNMRVSDVSPAT
jgi:hypothetical protein